MTLSKNRIKYIHALEMKKTRKADRVFLAEGPKLVGDLLGHVPCLFLAATAEWLAQQPHPRAEEVTEVEPGYPYIYRAEADKATFYTEGEALERPITQGTNNLRGYFQYIGTAAVGTYVLNASGEWERVTGTRPKVGNYKAILTKAAGLPVLDGWQGATMPIHGVTDELGDPTGVRDVRRQDTATEVYDLQGIRRDAVKARGVYIMRQGGKAKVTTAAPQQ